MKSTSKKVIRIPIIVPIIIIAAIAIIMAGYLGTKLITNAARYTLANASTTEDGRFEYTELSNGTINIRKYVGTDTEVTIPDTIDGKSVTTIGICAFDGCSSLTSIEIPEGVTSIGYAAFYGCRALTNVVIPESVTNIEEFAFYQCKSLKNIEIPEGVINIGEHAFGACDSLTNINIPNTVTSIESNALGDCNSLTEINVSADNENYSSDNGILFNKTKTYIIKYPEGKTESTYKIPEGVTNIGEEAFDDCDNITSIEIPEGVTNIGDYAFGYCRNLINITIPNTVTNIGENIFKCCFALTEINVKENNQSYCSDNGILFNKAKTQIIKYPLGNTESTYKIPEGVISIESGAFENCDNLINITIPDTVTIIGNNAFDGCSKLTDIKNSNQLINIGEEAFLGCYNLTSLTIPNTVLSIGDLAFGNCSSLMTIGIPESITSIGKYVFRGCSKLTAINVDSNNNFYKSIEGVLFDKEGTTLMQYPRSKGQIYKIPENTKKIENYAFDGSNIKYLDIPEGLTTIGDYSPFGSGEFLKRIRIPDSITYMNTSIFNKSQNLIIYCNAGSYAEEYAIKNNILYDAWENYQTEMEIIEIQFEDANLYNAVINGGIGHINTQTSVLSYLSRNILNKDDSNLTIKMEKEDVLYVNNLDIYSAEVKSIKGIENFKNLERIWAGKNEIEDITPISNLTNLTIIDFEYNNISEVSALKNLENLTTIYLMGNMKIKNIEALQNLTQLECLDLTANLIEDITPITNLINLKELYFGINSIKTIDNLGNLTNLKILVLSNNELEDISEISKLTQLEELYLGEKVSTPHYIIDTVSGHIVGNKIKDISSLSNLTKLKTLGIECNNIADITPIKELDLSDLYAQKQELKINIQTSVNTGNIEIELPKLFVDAKDKTSIAYTEEDFESQNCDFNEEKNKIIISSESIGKEVYVQINGGVLDETKLIINVEKESKLEIVSEKYKIENEYIANVEPKTTIEELKQELVTNATEVNVYNKDNEKQDDTDTLGTGMTIEFQVNDKTYTYTIVVSGDTDGDGEANFKDLVIINKHRLRKKILEGAYLMAGDVNADSKADFKDIVKVNKYRLNQIEQLINI